MVYTPANFTDYQAVTGSLSAFKYPSKATNLVSGSGIYPHHNPITWLSQPQCSPPGEFIPRNSILKSFKNKETCFEYYRRLHALGWTTNPLGVGQKMPRNFNWKTLAYVGTTVAFLVGVTQVYYMTAIHYPKTFTQDWAEAEVLHPRLNRTHLQRSDYQTEAFLGTFDVRWPRWAKLEN
eukprot:TRINITY_DN252_c0_g2_i1.p3 TRINITY_DN252_c0_g2~~TRINITY_DN252_c0_g2_i1.p3  ORF type:complete len:179 (+),score=58.79 TRINITY_DN252_c0_g2_i1:54-590(+)